MEKGNNRGDGADLFFSLGVTGITPLGTSAGLPYPNTKGYQGGIIRETGIIINNISAASSNMTFYVTFGAITAQPTTSKPIMAQPVTGKRITAKPITHSSASHIETYYDSASHS